MSFLFFSLIKNHKYEIIIKKELSYDKQNYENKNKKTSLY